MKVIREDIVTVGGVQNQFIGVQVGDFLLVPDSDSGTRPDDLRVKGQTTTLLVEGGKAPLRVKLHSEGISRRGFESRLSADQKALLTKLASDLAGRVWPDAREALRQRIETLGECEVFRVLQNLFEGVEDTMKRIKFYSSIPLVGRRLADSLYPYNN